MIPLNEIRIGIYYSTGFITGADFKQHHIIKQVKNLLDISHAHISGNGIPLTPEILEKCGFNKTNRIAFDELKPCYAIFSFALMLRHDSYFFDWRGGNTEIKYLHQLQNLYLDLTGEELNPTF